MKTTSLIILCLSLLANSQEADSSKVVRYPFTAYIHNVKIVHLNDDDAPYVRYSYSWSDVVNHKSNSSIICGFNANYQISVIIDSVWGSHSPLSAGDSVNFIIHSPAQLGIFPDALPQRCSLELYADMSDTTQVTFNLYPFIE